MNDNKIFWQRYAPIYAMFMKKADKAYIEICERIKPYLNDEMKVLELACGTGNFSFLLAEKAKSWEATDFSENMILQAKAAQKSYASIKNLNFSVQDATNLPYEDGSFDAVMIANALHIMPNPEKVLSEIRRVLKKGGVLFAPTFVLGEGMGFALRSGLIQLFGFKAFLKPTIKEFGEFIEKNGFAVVEYEKIGSRVAPLCCMIAKN